jgi:hypothetical protein
MRIELHKLSDERHALEIVREHGARERVECETRSYLLHDLLHYAVEAESGLDDGFWGLLARGKTLADMNDRSGAALAGESTQLMAIEQMVGTLTTAAKGTSAADVVEALTRYFTGLAAPVPAWVSVAYVDAIQARMRRLLGHWRAIAYGGTLTLEWPPARG